MSLLCYVTEQVQKDATSHGIAKDRLEKFAADVEERQSLSGFDHFPPPCLVKKKIFGFNFRLIAAEKLIGDNLVVVFLRLLIRGGGEYSTLRSDPSKWALASYEAAVDEQELARWVEERTEITPPLPPPAITPAESTFLWTNSYSGAHDDVMVCETAEWSAGIREGLRVDLRLILLPQLILAAIDLPPGEPKIVRSTSDSELAIIACMTPAADQCVLLSVGYGQSDDQLNSQCQIWRQRLEAANSETVLRYSRRSYPSIVCCDDEMWITVQKDPQANLALSPEEAEILRVSQSFESEKPAFPLFINGRAGSGKSTLLQYLFADCFLRWAAQFDWKAVGATRPLYFASSRELLKVAQEIVRSLLKSNHEHLLTSLKVDPAVLETIDLSFQDHIRYMRSLVGDEGDRRFPLGNYVGYSRFRRLWLQHFGKEKKAVHDYGPQISWHVIRGYIKGMSIDDYLARDDYDELPEEERTISRYVYETVFDRVWTAWYEPHCRSGDYWDSQDLVRFLVSGSRCPASHVAVFCDEAQDFTRLELEALYRCSLFSNRQIDFASLKRVPFVFAGDPFQTLNPTGFRWESVRAAFTERIMRSLYRFKPRAEMPKLNYQELSFNYRSSERIVQLCNSIQAVRALVFDHSSLCPQRTWQLREDSSTPVFFEKGDAQIESALKEQTDLVLIVPCEEGEEIEFVANDMYLKSLVQSDTDGTPRNVLSAARAKGLEFLRVALYGWSQRDEAKTLAARVKSCGSCEPLTVDQRLGLEYFMNNLYVAASRARRRLFVIDEKSARDGLWWFASDEQNLAHVISELKNSGTWMEHSGLLVQGVAESLNEDRDDPKAIAIRFEREGRSKEDSYLLKQASLQFALAGEPGKAHECRAVAHLYDGRYKDAGDYFVKASQFEQAIGAYWKGQLYGEIANCSAEQPDHARRPECRLAAYLVGSAPTIREARTLIELLLENAATNGEFQIALRTPLWGEAIDEALRRCFASAEKSMLPFPPSEHGSVADCLARLERYGVSPDARLYARLLFFAGRFQEAASRHPEDGSDFSKEVKARSLIAEHESSGRGYVPAEKKLVAEYYYRQRLFVPAAALYQELADPAPLLECLRQSSTEAVTAGAEQVLKSALIALVAGGEWDSLLGILKNGEPRPGTRGSWSKEEREAVRQRIIKEKTLFTVAIPELARSETLSSADGKSQQKISNFLADLLIQSSTAWQEVLARKVAGAAIERAGKDIDALKFYEAWRGARVAEPEREYADRRWVVCKRRQAMREEYDGQAKKANAHRQDANEVMEKYGWSETDVPNDFPDLSDAGNLTAGRTPALAAKKRESKILGPSETSGKLGVLSFQLFAAKGWINIAAADGLQARVLLRERKVVSTDVQLVDRGDGEIECVEWGLRVRWLSDEIVQLAIGGASREFDVPEPEGAAR